MASILHLVSGKTLEVLDDPEDAARILWSSGGDGHDSGYASLEGKGAIVRVNPKTVIYVELAPQTSTRFSV